MEKSYSYNCTFDPDMHTKFSIEFCTSDEETYLKVKKALDDAISLLHDISDNEYE